MKATKWKGKLLIGIALLCCVALLAFPKVLPISSWLADFTAFIRNSGWKGYLWFALAYVLGAILFFPGALLTLAAGFAFGFVKGTAISIVSATAGASCSFLIGRYFLRETIERRVRTNPKLMAFDEAIRQEGAKIILLLRLSPLIPFNFSNYFFGITKIGFWKYLILSFVGMLPGTMLYVYLGQAGQKTLQGKEGKTPLEWVFLGLGLIATLALSLILARMARRALGNRAA